MTKSMRTIRIAAAVAVGGAAAVVGAGSAAAEPIDIQPTPLLCSAGIPDVQSVTHDEQEAVEAEEILYVVNEAGGGGATVSWINVNTGVSGSATFEGAADWHNIPVAHAEPEAGTVLSAVWGLHENAAGEQCFLLPGIDIAQVPGEPGDPD